MDAPEPALAPVIPPEIAPIVQVKVLAAEAVNAISVLVPLQIVFAFAVITSGTEVTVTLVVTGEPTHPPVAEVGVMMYGTVPEEAFPGYTND